MQGQQKQLLSIIELGGYPDFSALYRSLGYKVESLTTLRKAKQLLAKGGFSVVVCEFNFQSDFRDRTSSLETLMAILQRHPETKVVVFYEQEYAHQFQRVQERFPIHAAFSFPIDEAALEACLSPL